MKNVVCVLLWVFASAAVATADPIYPSVRLTSGGAFLDGLSDDDLVFVNADGAVLSVNFICCFFNIGSAAQLGNPKVYNPSGPFDVLALGAVRLSGKEFHDVESDPPPFRFQGSLLAPQVRVPDSGTVSYPFTLAGAISGPGFVQPVTATGIGTAFFPFPDTRFSRLFTLEFTSSSPTSEPATLALVCGGMERCAFWRGGVGEPPRPVEVDVRHFKANRAARSAY